MKYDNLFKYSLFMCIPLLMAATNGGQAQNQFENCIEAVLAEKPGRIIKVERKVEGDLPVYEFDVQGNNNHDWDIECRADTAKIIEIEEEVYDSDATKFLEKKQLKMFEAQKVALEAYPGEIIELEFEIEADGTAVYEFDIKQANGDEIKIEINAETGETHDFSRELWQIGYE